MCGVAEVVVVSIPPMVCILTKNKFAYFIFQCYLCTMEKKVTYWRNPTKAEIAFGYGAIHYREFPLNECVRKDGKPKRWLKAKDDGLRYNY